MKANLGCNLKPYIQPFERELAYRELEALTRVRIRENGHTHKDKTHWLCSSAPADMLARELAFWESVSNGQRFITRQALREATVYETPKSKPTQLLLGEPSASGEIALPNRRCLRYGPHGLHEYRGKFFPQLVRAFINIGQVPKNGIVADPFCGSGTTVIETILADRHPLV